MDLPKLAAGLGIVTAETVVALVVRVLLVGLLVELSGAGRFFGVIGGVMGAVRWVIAAGPVAATVVLGVAPVAVVIGAWREGRRRGSPPAWTLSPAQRDGR